MKRDGFTLPGEAGYEALTLELAERWGADVIRDSDGTKLSPEITGSGYRIYSTLCIIREHNAFAEAHPDAQQQTFLCSKAVTAEGTSVVIPLMDGYFTEQLAINESPDALRYMQVYDRTENAEGALNVSAASFVGDLDGEIKISKIETPEEWEIVNDFIRDMNKEIEG